MYGIDAPYMRSIVLRVPAYSELRLRRYRRSGLVLSEVAAEYVLANFQRDPVLREAFGPLLPEMRHAMLAQLAHGEDLYGGVLLYSTQQFGAFAPADYMLLEKLATQASLAIANAQLRIHSMANAAEEERSRLARDLHDSVSQALFGMTLGVETALQQLETDTAAAAESMHYALSLARAAKSEMRALIFQLRPDMLSQIGLHGAFEAQATAMKARHGLVVNLHCETAEPALPLDRKEAVYRVASEALHNIVKHAQARHVNIRAYHSDNGYCVLIRDDGIGFDATRRHIGSFGLHSMRDRIETLGGRIIIESEHGQGTSVLLCMPECS
jgi:signal transduction histidine kinase